MRHGGHIPSHLHPIRSKRPGNTRSRSRVGRGNILRGQRDFRGLALYRQWIERARQLQRAAVSDRSRSSSCVQRLSSGWRDSAPPAPPPSQPQQLRQLLHWHATAAIAQAMYHTSDSDSSGGWSCCPRRGNYVPPGLGCQGCYPARLGAASQSAAQSKNSRVRNPVAPKGRHALNTFLRKRQANPHHQEQPWELQGPQGTRVPSTGVTETYSTWSHSAGFVWPSEQPSRVVRALP